MLFTACSNNKNPDFEHYGVYLESTDGFEELKNSHKFNTIGGRFEYFKDTDDFHPASYNINEPFSIYIYDPGAKLQSYNLYNGLTIDVGYDNGRASYNCYGCDGYGDKPDQCSEIELLKIPVKGNDELIELKANVNFGGTIALIIDEKNGYIVNLFNEKYFTSFFNYISTLIKSLENKEFKEFAKSAFPGLDDKSLSDNIEFFQNPKNEKQVQELLKKLKYINKDNIEFYAKSNSICCKGIDACFSYIDNAWQLKE